MGNAKLVKTPRDAKGSSALKLLERTTASVCSSRLPPRSGRSLRHAHAIRSARHVTRIDKRD